MKSTEISSLLQKKIGVKIVLLGYMGSGKTTIGRELAKQFDFQFLDLDEYIEVSEDMGIPEIFDVKGEIYFRKKEHEYLQEILKEKEDFVLSIGGGTPCYGENMDAILKETKNAIYLKVAIKGLVERLSKEKEDRPLIKSIPDIDLAEFIGKHLFERSFFYTKANHTVECDGKEPHTILKEIKSILNSF